MTRWIAAAGAFVVSLDSMVNIAFPSMAAAFRVPPEQMRWVIICYVGTYAFMSFGGGALADRVGHGRVFSAGLALSAVGFVLSGTAPTFGWLLGGRVVQGVAAGLVYGTAPGLVTLAALPEARGRALGFVNVGIGLAFTTGPLIAGLLVDAFGWRAVFHIRVAPALAALAWTLAALPAGRAAVDHCLVSLRQIVRAPVLHAGLLSFIANAGIFAIWLLAPFYLVERRGLDARVGGVLFMLTPLGWTLGAPLGGRLADRMGARGPVMAGLALEAAGLWLLSRAGPTTPMPALAAALFGAGLGLGLFQVPNMASVMAAFGREQQGAAGGLAFLARTLGVVAGVLVFAQVFAARRGPAGFDAAFGEVYVAAAVAVAVAALLALVPRGRSPRAGGTRRPP
jgi:MFS family permease